jgi:hypothetical protein
MLDIFQFHHLVGEEFQGPALPPIGSLTTRQMNQLGLALAIQAALLGSFAWEATGEGDFQIFLHKPSLDTNHRAATDIQGFGNLPIGVPGFSPILIAHQKHARHQIMLGWSTAHVYHCLQPAVLLSTQSHRIAVVRGSHACTPSLRRTDLVGFLRPQ